MTKQSIRISYNLETTDTLTVFAEAEGQNPPESPESPAQEGILKLTLKDAKTGQILQENSAGGCLPLSCHIGLDISAANEKGAFYYAVAVWKTTPAAGTSQTEKLPIHIESIYEALCPSCCYTMTAKAETGRPAACSVRDSGLSITAAPGFLLEGELENGCLEYHSGSGEPFSYSGAASYGEGQISFPDEFPIDNDSALPLPLSFSCEVTFRKEGQPDTRRRATLTYSPRKG